MVLEVVMRRDIPKAMYDEPFRRRYRTRQRPYLLGNLRREGLSTSSDTPTCNDSRTFD